MAVGDDATAAGFPLVPDTGEEGRIRWGSREINRTRDEVAQVKALIPSSKAGYRTFGSASPTGGSDGDIYFKLV